MFASTDKLYELARVIDVTQEYKNESELFYKKREFADYIEYSSDSWMNLFAGKKYARYCELGDIYLRLNCAAQYEIQIIGVDLVDGEVVETKLEYFQKDNIFQIPAAKSHDGVFLD